MLDLGSALDDVVRELDTANRAQVTLQRRIETLEAEKHGLELALARHNGTGAELAAVNGEVKEWQGIPRTEAVLRVLEYSDLPLGPADITRQLHEHGRTDQRDWVAAALAYLKRAGRVSHAGPGAWAAKDSEIDHFPSEGGGPP